MLDAGQSSTLARSALRKGGRAGLPIMNSITSAGSDTAKIAGNQFGLRPTDGWLIGTMAEMKINLERFNEITYVMNLGGHVVAETAAILGGYCGGPAKAVEVDHFTPMEPKRASEIAHGVIGMTRTQENEIVIKLLAKYEDDIPTAPKGKTYEQCWDMKTKQPIREYKHR